MVCQGSDHSAWADIRHTTLVVVFFDSTDQHDFDLGQQQKIAAHLARVQQPLGLAQRHGNYSELNAMNITITDLKGDPAFKYRSTRDWRYYQLSLLGADEIDVDHRLKSFVRRHCDLAYDVSWAHPQLAQFVHENARVAHDDFDYFLITDLEFGKLPVNEIMRTIRDLYDRSRAGGYFSMQSYYFNWTNDPAYVYPDLDDDADVAAEQWIKQKLAIYSFTNESLVIKQPLNNIDSRGRVIAGVDFMYTHGNMRFWLWKK